MEGLDQQQALSLLERLSQELTSTRQDKADLLLQVDGLLSRQLGSSAAEEMRRNFVQNEVRQNPLPPPD